VRVVSFYPAANSTLSWTADQDVRFVGGSSSIDALVHVDAQLTWLEFVSQTAGSVVENLGILLRSTYSSVGVDDRFFGFEIPIPRGQKIFVSAGTTGGVVQLIFKTSADVTHVLIDNV